MSVQERQQLKNNGGFYLEKYVRTYRKKEENQLDTSIPDDIPHGIQNIIEFKQYLNSKEISEDINISDWFGNAKINPNPKEGEPGYMGSIGIKFGVRLVYVMSQELSNELELSQRPDLSQIINKSKRERTFALSSPLIGRVLYIPLVSYEKDILDVKLKTLQNSSDNLDQDLKCFVDGLAESDKFKLIFNRIFNIKKIGSVLACYSDLNFISALGLGIAERQPPDTSVFANIISGGSADNIDLPSQDDRTETFNDSKHEARKIFVSNYKRNDFDPPDEENNYDESSLFTQKLLNNSYAIASLGPDVGYFTRRRIKTSKPTDKEGKECQNQFAGLFNIKR